MQTISKMFMWCKLSPDDSPLSLHKHTTLWRGTHVQARAAASLWAQAVEGPTRQHSPDLNRAVVPGLLQPTDKLLPQAGRFE